MNSNKGFTTIELIIAIAIAGIIMGAVGTFLVFNLRSFNVTTDVINVQYEGQLALNQLTDIAKQSTGILEIEDNSSPATSLLNSQAATTPYYMRFEHYETDALDVNLEVTTRYEIDYDEDNKRLLVTVTYKLGELDESSESYILADNITSFRIKPINTSTTYADTDSIQIFMTLQDEEATLDLQTHVKFRNKWN